MDTFEATYRIPKDVILRQVAGETLLFNLPAGRTFTLNEVGLRMWQLLGEYGQAEPAAQALLAEYEVDEAELRAGLNDLIAALTQNGLLLVDKPA